MIEAIDFFFYRIRIAYYLKEETDMSFKEAWGFSEGFDDSWVMEENPYDAVLEELSYWND